MCLVFDPEYFRETGVLTPRVFYPLDNILSGYRVIP